MGTACTKIDTEKKEEGPMIGEILFFSRTGGFIGQVIELDDNKCNVKLPGPSDATFDGLYWGSGSRKVELIPELNELLVVGDEMKGLVTVMFRGVQCHGWITGYLPSDDGYKPTDGPNLFIIKFRPDDANKYVDVTDFDMGATTNVSLAEITKGHVDGAAERPPVRDAAMIASDKKKIKEAKVVYTRSLHCASCGIGIWENACDCYVTRVRKGICCQACGKEHEETSDRCCGAILSGQLQTGGWAGVLSERYGYF